jgi:hypothetical protein
MNKYDEHKNQVEKAIEIGKILPETKEKVLFYKEIIESERELIEALEKRKNSFFVSNVNKAKERAEIVRLKNSIIQKQKVYESYVNRKNEYEKWLDEMALEVNTKFEEVLKEAEEIPYTSNPRLQDGIKTFMSMEETNTLQDRVEFYLFVKNEIQNYKKFGKKK